MMFGADPLAALYIAVGLIGLGLTVLAWLYAHKPETATLTDSDAELRALRAELDQQRGRVDWLQGQAMTQGQQIARLQRENEALKAELAALRAENAQLHAINEHLGKSLDSRRTATRSKAPAGLRKALTERLNDDELRALCSDLGIPYDDLAGEGYGARARSAVDYAERHCRIDDLLDWLSKNRPEVEV